MELKIGKNSSKELAQWFNVSYNTYKNNISKYLSILEDYCKFEKIFGGAIIEEIYIKEYDKNLNVKDKKIYTDEINYCIERQNGLSTVAGMARKYVRQGEYENENTARRRLNKSGVELFGKTDGLSAAGEIGVREYVWAIKVNDFNQYRFMTEEEEQIFNDIIMSCFSGDVETIKSLGLLDDMLKNKEIDVDEYFEKKERFGNYNFQGCLFQFKKETGEVLVRATKHQLKAFK